MCVCVCVKVKAFEKMDHLAKAQRLLELQEAENARVSQEEYILGLGVKIYRRHLSTAATRVQVRIQAVGHKYK